MFTTYFAHKSRLEMLAGLICTVSYMLSHGKSVLAFYDTSEKFALRP